MWFKGRFSTQRMILYSHRVYTTCIFANFIGTGWLQYEPTEHFEAGIGQSRFQTITAMRQYQQFSVEELRMEDYNASGGLFGSKFAKLSGALCQTGKEKLTPCHIAHFFSETVSTIASEVLKDDSSPASQIVGVKNHVQTEQKKVTNLVIQGITSNVSVQIESGAHVNVFFRSNVDRSNKQSDSNKSSRRSVSQRERKSKERSPRKSCHDLKKMPKQ